MAKATLLIAEDNPDTRSLLRWLLESEGFDVTTAEDGAAALKFLDLTQPDVILTDLMMPQVDGIELIRRVRGSSDLANIPIVALTAYGSNYIAQAKNAGANATLRKPEDLDQLVDTINQFIPQAISNGH